MYSDSNFLNVTAYSWILNLQFVRFVLGSENIRFKNQVPIIIDILQWPT
jgi:hypothetical protein